MLRSIWAAKRSAKNRDWKSHQHSYTTSNAHTQSLDILVVVLSLFRVPMRIFILQFPRLLQTASAAPALPSQQVWWSSQDMVRVIASINRPALSFDNLGVSQRHAPSAIDVIWQVMSVPFSLLFPLSSNGWGQDTMAYSAAARADVSTAATGTHLDIISKTGQSIRVFSGLQHQLQARLIRPKTNATYTLIIVL